MRFVVKLVEECIQETLVIHFRNVSSHILVLPKSQKIRICKTFALCGSVMWSLALKEELILQVFAKVMRWFILVT